MPTNKTPYFKEMADADLVDAYWHYRILAANAANGRMAGSLGRCLRNIDVIVSIARRRHLDLGVRP